MSERDFSNSMMELLDGMKGDKNKFSVGVQILESKMLRNLIENKGSVQKIRVKTQELDLETRAIKISKVFTKAYEMGGSFNKPCHEDYGVVMIETLRAEYGAYFPDGWGLGLGLSPNDIRKQSIDEIEALQDHIGRIAAANFTRSARILESYTDRPLEGSLGDAWRPVSDCRNLEKSIDPKDMDALEYGRKYQINCNWKLLWTEADGLVVRSEELTHKASETCYEGQPKLSM